MHAYIFPSLKINILTVTTKKTLFIASRLMIMNSQPSLRFSGGILFLMFTVAFCHRGNTEKQSW